GDVEHGELAVEGGVGEGGLGAEEERLRGERARRRLEQRVRARYEVVALPLVEAAGAELALLDQRVEGAVAGAFPPVVSDGGGGDAEEHVLERAVAPVAVRPDRSVLRRRHQSGGCR